MNRQKFILLLCFLCFWSLGSFRSLGAPAETIFFYQRGYVSGGTSKATTLTNAAVAGFKLRHPNVNVVIVGLPWSREGDLKLRSALLNRGRIDVFRVTNDQLPDFIPTRGTLLSSIEPYLTPEDRADIIPTALEAVTHNGRPMAWPLWSTANILIGSTEIMRARGVEPAPPTAPWTWDQFKTNLRKSTFTAADGQRTYGFTSPARPPLFEWSPLLWAHAGPIFQRAGAGEAPKSETQSLTFAPGLPDALAKVAELKAEGLTPPSFGIDDQPATQAQFLSGEAAFIMTSPAFISTLADRNFPYVIMPPPLGDYGRPITTGALGCFAVVARPDNPERERLAHEFARYLTSAEVAQDAPGWFLAPPVRKSINVFRADPKFQGLMDIVPSAVYLNPPGGAGFLEGVIIPNFQAAIIGETAPQTAISQIQKAYARRALK